MSAPIVGLVSVDDLRALPLPTFEALGCSPMSTYKGEPLRSWRQAEAFLYPCHGWRCIGCDRKLAGDIFAAFEWGLAHGEGRCGSCGWPARAIHTVTTADGVEHRVSMVLQYHPDALVRQERAE